MAYGGDANKKRNLQALPPPLPGSESFNVWVSILCSSFVVVVEVVGGPAQ